MALPAADLSPLTRFLIRVLLWLPVCFFGWILLAPSVIWLCAVSVNAALLWALPSLIERVASEGLAISVWTNVAGTPSTQVSTGYVLFDVNPLKYAYGQPLYTALVLATPAQKARQLGLWLVGIFVLLALQVFGVSMEIVKVLAFDVNDASRLGLGLAHLGYEIVALAYQLGYLLFPAAAPVILWLAQFRHRLPDIIGEAARID